jgi:glycosyltransferase involved in cell wall biosynthesis
VTGPVRGPANAGGGPGPAGPADLAGPAAQDLAGPRAGHPPRIAFVLGLATGGTAAHAAALAAGCRAAGCAVSLFAPGPALEHLGLRTGPEDAGQHRAGLDGIAAFEIQIGDRPSPASDPAAVRRLRSGLAGWEPDVVHAHGVRAGAFAGLALGSRRQPGRPALAVTVHNAPPDGRAAALVYGELERLCARRADVVLCASPDLLARMRDRGARSAERFDVPAPAGRLPTAAEVAAVRDEIAAAGRPVVLSVARLAPQKGLDVLIDAISRLRERDPRPVTVIAGDGPLAASLASQAEQSGAEVRMLGNRQDVGALLALATVVVVPSRWEARALIIQEAMRAGRPVVATRTGGTAELTGEEAALLVPAGEPAALAKAITAVLDDQRLAGRLGEAGRARSTTFPSQQDAVRAALAIYARLAASRLPARHRR